MLPAIGGDRADADVVIAACREPMTELEANHLPCRRVASVVSRSRASRLIDMPRKAVARREVERDYVLIRISRSDPKRGVFADCGRNHETKRSDLRRLVRRRSSGAPSSGRETGGGSCAQRRDQSPSRSSDDRHHGGSASRVVGVRPERVAVMLFRRPADRVAGDGAAAHRPPVRVVDPADLVAR